MSATTATWTEQTSALIASAAIAAGALNRATFNLSAKYAARVFIALGRTANTAFTGNPASVVIRGSHNNFAFRSPSNVFGVEANSATANSTTLSAGTTAGATSFSVASATGFSSGGLVCLSPGDANQEEWCRISKVSGTTITPDSPLINAHDNADTVTTAADAWEVLLPGGQYYELIVDYGGATAGSNYRVQAWYQTYDSDTTA